MATTLNLYPNLPGILTEFKDGGLQLRTDPNPPATESILLIGTAVDGPKGVPVAVDSTTYEAVFGRATDKYGRPNGATLPVGFEEAWLAGCRDIRLMRISGESASVLAACESVTVRREELKEQGLGVAPGNIEMVINLGTELALEAGETIVADSVVVLADGYTLPDSAYSVEYVSNTVTINPDVCSVGAVLTIHATVDDGVEQNSRSVTKVAEGAEQTYQLEAVPVENTLMLYADGAAVDSSKFSVSGNTLMVSAGAAPLGSTLVVRYLTYVTEVVADKGIKISSINAGSLYNESTLIVSAITRYDDQTGNVEIIGKSLKLVKPASKRRTSNEEPLEYSSLDYPTLESMVNAINNDPNNGIFKAEVDPDLAEESSLILETTPPQGIKFEGGDDGLKLSKNEMYELLGGKRDADGNLIEQGAYQLLENYNVDWIVPLGVYADDRLPDTKKNFAQQLAMACAYISVRQHTTYGVIATKSPIGTSLKDIDAHVNNLIERRNDYFVTDKFGDPILDADGKPFDVGQYIHVLAGPDVVLRNSKLGTYATNSPVIFAAMMTTMRPGSSPLNKQVPGVSALRFNYSNAHRDRLTAARYVTYKTKSNGAIVAVEDAMTCAQPGSDYARTTTARVVKAAVDEVKDACDPFLGEPNNVPNRNAMSAAIDKRLSRMKEAGDLTDYRFNIIATLVDQVLGRAKIELTLVPPFELRQITIVVNLTPEL